MPPSFKRFAPFLLLAFVTFTPLARAGDQEYSGVMAWGKLEVFESSDARHLRHRAFDPQTGAWTGWQEIDGTMLGSSPSAVLTDGGTRLAVFYRGPDGRLYHVYRDKDKPWSRVILLGDREMKGGPDAVIVSGVLTVFARTVNGHLMKIYYDVRAGSWTQWSDVD